MPRTLEPLTIARILELADKHHARNSRWPISRDGTVLDAPDLTWEAINTALRKGCRGMKGGDSLAKVLKRRRGVTETRRKKPAVTRQQILAWIDQHFRSTGEWPHREAGRVVGGGGLSWNTVNRYLRHGSSAMEGGSTLNQVLRELRGVWDGGKPLLTNRRIIDWAQAHYNAFGRWPVTVSGYLHKLPEENWAAIDMALRHGRRGLPGGDSLSRLLTREFGSRYRANPQQLAVRDILAWADDFHRRKGRWPANKSGRIHANPRLTWGALDARLRRGITTHPQGISLRDFLREHGRE